MRLQLLVGGHMPRTENLPATWYDTPNIHFCTIKDFVQLCDEINVKMERAVALDMYGRPLRVNLPWWFWNMFGEQGVFLLSLALSTRYGEPSFSRFRFVLHAPRRTINLKAISDRAPASVRLPPAR